MNPATVRQPAAKSLGESTSPPIGHMSDRPSQPSPAIPKQCRHRACTAGRNTKNTRMAVMRVDFIEEVMSVVPPDLKKAHTSKSPCTHVQVEEVHGRHEVDLVSQDLPTREALGGVFRQKVLERK